MSGAVHVVAPHPANANTLFIGTVNGGVWRTLNAQSASPSWTPLTDQLGSLSIGALVFDPTDGANNTIVAGIGRFSSFGQEGGPRTGLQRTVNGGSTWSEINGGGLLTGKNISGVVARGNTLVVAVNTADIFSLPNTGIFRSVNGGASFTQISGGAGTGLPGGVCNDLTADPVNQSVLYAPLNFSTNNGIYKSSDTGATWTRVSSAAMDALILAGTTSNIEIAVGRNNNVFVGIINRGQLAGLFFSPDGGTTWTLMDTPQTNEAGGSVGVHPKPKGDGGPGSQGTIHFSIAADPTTATIVYVGGDRQPAGFNDFFGFPNAIGATDFSGRLFRGDASRPPGSQWVHLTHSRNLGAAGGGTASSSAPHADSRDMAFDAAGNLLEGDDGGIWKRTNARTNTGDWFSLNGSGLQITEAHDVAYDGNARVVMSGNQDTGTTRQLAPGGQAWLAMHNGDGGDVAVETRSRPGFSVAYTSFQNIGGFRRTVFDAANNAVQVDFPALNVTNGVSLRQFPNFVNPAQINTVDPLRLVFVGAVAVYESFDQGETLRVVGTNIFANATPTPLAYGGRRNGAANPDVLYVGEGSVVLLRTNNSLALNPTTSPFPGTSVTAIALDSADFMTAYVCDSQSVHRTANGGTSWSNLTGNLTGVGRIWCLRYLPGFGVNGILVGTDVGIFLSRTDQPGVWSRVSSTFPNALVWDTDYDAATDALVVSTMGRGVWLLPNAAVQLLGDTLPPRITANPLNVTVNPGATATFSLTAFSAAPLTYQWRFNGFNLPGETNITLTVTNVQLAQAGGYAARVANSNGFTFSATATLGVNSAPAITAQPASIAAVAGDPVTFSVTATGSEPLAYRWLLNGNTVPGAISSTLFLPVTQITNAGSYTVVVTNSLGSVTSSIATLTVDSPPFFVVPPASRIVTSGAQVSFTATVLGNAPFTYQWRFNGADLPGATNTAFSIASAAASHSGLYSLAVANALGQRTSAAAVLTVLPLSVTVPWASTAGGSGSDVGRAIALDPAGNAFVTGTFNGTATFGATTLTSAGQSDIFVAKHDGSGQLLWARRAGGPGFDTGAGIAVDASGNCYITGSFEAVATFSTTSLSNSSPSSYADIFVAKYDSAGNLVWVRGTGAEFTSDTGEAIALDPAGNVLITGRSVQDTFGTAALTNLGRILVAKYDNAGNPVWARKSGSFSGGTYDTGTGIGSDAAGNVYVTGTFLSPLADFGGVLLTNRGSGDVFLSKLDPAGTLLWVRQAGGTGDERPNGLAVDAAGNAHIVGEFGGTAAFGVTNLTSAGGASDIFIAKFNTSGSALWARSAGGQSADAARGVAVDPSGNVHVTGYFGGAASFGAINLSGIIGTFDAFVTRLDASGNFTFAQQAGGTDLNGDSGLGIAADAAGNAVVTGYFTGTGTLGNGTPTSAGGEDLFVMRFNSFIGGAVTPTLSFSLSGGKLVISWPVSASAFILQTATNLGLQNWVDATNTLSIVNSDFVTTNSLGSGPFFLRLRRP
ncbi:MAG: immunoglobulin domain-containing protein [Verrucomicrobia bacterium]|nr:immunoglobulin domain-containing protein [Verrucomicrobiota bacterium]